MRTGKHCEKSFANCLKWYLMCFGLTFEALLCSLKFFLSWFLLLNWIGNGIAIFLSRHRLVVCLSFPRNQKWKKIFKNKFYKLSACARSLVIACHYYRRSIECSRSFLAHFSLENKSPHLLFCLEFLIGQPRPNVMTEGIF